MKKPATAARKSFIRERRLSDAEVVARAERDPDNPPRSPAQLKNFHRGSLARQVRHKLGLSQDAFARRYGIPVATLRAWEQNRQQPDQATRSYLEVIAKIPEAVGRAREEV